MSNYFSFSPDYQGKHIYTSITDICGNNLYCYSDTTKRFCETNNDLTLIDSSQNLWQTVEYELKLDITSPCHLEMMLHDIVMALSNNYSHSTAHFRCSFEHHYSVTKNGEYTAIAVLGKHNQKSCKAIKIKQGMGLGRVVRIERYTNDDMQALCANAEIQSHPAFYKRKYRYILVNRLTGTVFGVSISKAEFLSKRFPAKTEIEIEYWSNLLPEHSKHYFNQENELELYDIAAKIKTFLTERGICYNFPGVRKNEWLRKLN